MNIKPYFALRLIILFFAIFGLVNALSAQSNESEPPTFYRYFEISWTEMTDNQRSKFSNSIANHPSFRIHANCPAGKKVLVAVPASYPKRIDDIQTELEELYGAVIPKSTLTSIEIIALPATTNFCK